MATPSIAAPRTIPADVQQDILTLTILRKASARYSAGVERWPVGSTERRILQRYAENLQSAVEERREKIAARLTGIVRTVRA